MGHWDNVSLDRETENLIVISMPMRHQPRATNLDWFVAHYVFSKYLGMAFGIVWRGYASRFDWDHSNFHHMKSVPYTRRYHIGECIPAWESREVSRAAYRYEITLHLGVIRGTASYPGWVFDNQKGEDQNASP